MNKLATKFIGVMKDCAHISKSGNNSFHGYKYATCSDVLQKVNGALTKNGIASIVSPELISLVDVTTTKGNVEHLATVKTDITLIDQDSGETFTLRGLGSGQDAGDKAVMKAQTAAIKYAYLLSLAISTGDDPEADAHTDEVKFPSVNPTSSNRAALVCSACGANISQKVADYSNTKFGKPLCMKCQKAKTVEA